MSGYVSELSMTVRRITRLALPAVVAILVLAACGGGDEGDLAPIADPPVTEEPTLTREEVVSQGDAICAEVYAALSGLEASDATPALKVSQRADLYEGMVERLRGLDSDDPALTQVLAAGRDLVEAATAANSAAAEGDAEAVTVAEAELEDAVSEFRAQAAEFGFEKCAGDPEAPASISGAGSGETVTPSEQPGAVGPDPGEAPAEEPGGEPGGIEPPAGGGAPEGGGEAGGGEPGSGGQEGDGGSDTGGFSPG